jgi:hypothetical protein
MKSALFIVFLSFALGLPAHAAEGGLPYTWSDQTGPREMPWLGKGGRARWWVMDKTKPWDIMNPRGPELERRWGPSGRSGTNPYEDADHAMEYLARSGFLKPWPVYPPEVSQQGAVAFPYRITIVAIHPTVAVLRFDLAAVIEDPIPFSRGAFPPSQYEIYPDQGLGWSKTLNRVMFGTHVSSRGSLMWFCPEANIGPTPLDVASGHTEIALKDFRLAVDRKGEELELTWRAR